MGKKILQCSFAGGELSPAMYGRIDDNKYQTGLAECRNFIALPQGPVVTRPGFEFVRAAKYPGKKCRLIPFQFSASQTLVIEMGDKYMRFHTAGGTVMKGTQPYEISTPYAQADLFNIEYCQSGDIVTLVNSKYPPKELRRYGATDWRLVDIDFTGGISAPTGVKVYYDAGDTETTLDKTRYTCRYKVTALKDTDDGRVESAASASVSVACNIYIDDAYNKIYWNAVSGADSYRVYKSYSGVYGLIGETENLNFVDDNIAADESTTPPRYNSPLWGTSGDYPGTVCYFEQRRFFGGTKNLPQTIWATRPGTERDMSYTVPSLSDNRIKFRIAANMASKLNHLVPTTQLIALSESTVFRIASEISATSVEVKPQSSAGASNVTPAIVGNIVLYAASRGGHIYELGYKYESGGFVADDLCVRAGHLFETAYPVDQARMAAPDPVLWYAMSDGSLLGLTFMPEQGVGAWHRHDTTNGYFESVACVTEGNEDILYAVIRRKINGSTVRYIERMKERHFDNLEDAFQVDSGLTYEGSETNTISGLSHLEGQTVSILCDGAVLPQEVVKDGKIELENKNVGSKITVGLPITAEIKTLPMAMQANDGSYSQGHMKNVNKVWLRVYRSSGVYVGCRADRLTEAKQRYEECYGSPPNLISEEIPVTVLPSWNRDGQIVLRQVDPLPLELVGITAEYAT